MTDLLIDGFPVLVMVAVLTVGILGFQLRRHLGSGAYSAGPLDVAAPDPPGQEETPWELAAIDQQLRISDTAAAPALTRRYDLTATINRLSASAGLASPEEQLSITASMSDIEAAVARIEERLGLGPLEGDRKR